MEEKNEVFDESLKKSKRVIRYFNHTMFFQYFSIFSS